MNDDLFYEDKSYYLDPSKSYQKKDSSNLKISRDSVLNDYPYMRINRGDIVQENQNQDNDTYSRSSRRINYTDDNNLDDWDSPKNNRSNRSQVNKPELIRLPELIRKPIRFDERSFSNHQILKIKKNEINDDHQENTKGPVIHHHHYYINGEDQMLLIPPTLSPQFTSNSVPNNRYYSPRGSPLNYYTPKASPKYYTPIASPVYYSTISSPIYGDQGYTAYDYDNRYKFSTQMLPPLKMNQKYPVNTFNVPKGAYLSPNINKGVKRTTSLNNGLKRNYEGNYW